MVFMSNEQTHAGRITVWRCIGCGRIEGPQPCIGICEDRRVELVDASLYDEAITQSALYRHKYDVLEEFVRRLAHTKPRHGEWELCYRAFQDRARQTLSELAEADKKKKGES